MGAAIYTDTRQQAGKHEIKNEWWASHGVSTVRCKLDFGDYMTDDSNISVDTKRDVDAIAKNINGKQHGRFKRECQRAAAAGYRLVILVENDDEISDLEGLREWTNGHCRCCVHFRKRSCNPRDASTKCRKHGTRKPIQGDRLAKAMSTMSERYGVRFEFCEPCLGTGELFIVRFELAFTHSLHLIPGFRLDRCDASGRDYTQPNVTAIISHKFQRQFIQR